MAEIITDTAKVRALVYGAWLSSPIVALAVSDSQRYAVAVLAEQAHYAARAVLMCRQATLNHTYGTGNTDQLASAATVGEVARVLLLAADWFRDYQEGRP